MIVSFDEAQRILAEVVQPLAGQRVALSDAAGRVLAEPLLARNDAPRRAVSAMDGYAVANETTRPEQSLRLIGESRAGAGFAGHVGAGEAVRIFTGAPMPEGTDRCIMQEYAHVEGGRVRFAAGYGPGWHVRAAASDFRAGELLLAAGTLLSPQAMIAAAAADVASVAVAAQPRMTIIATGDELAAPGSAHLHRDAVPESVSLGVAAMARLHGALVTQRLTGIDDLATLSALAGEALAHSDLIVVAGGASVGDRDFAKPMFADNGLDLLFSKVAIKPGKPVWIGRADGKWVAGLPGNPTSAMVTARLFLLPLLARLQGRAISDAMRWRTLPLAGPLAATGTRETFVRARWDDAGLTPLANQDSGAQAALAAADWLIRCPPGQPARGAGETVTALLL